MRITRKQLGRIIKEEFGRISEGFPLHQIRRREKLLAAIGEVYGVDEQGAEELLKTVPSQSLEVVEKYMEAFQPTQEEIEQMIRTLQRGGYIRK